MESLTLEKCFQKAAFHKTMVGNGSPGTTNESQENYGGS